MTSDDASLHDQRTPMTSSAPQFGVRPTPADRRREIRIGFAIHPQYGTFAPKQILAPDASQSPRFAHVKHERGRDVRGPQLLNVSTHPLGDEASSPLPLCHPSNSPILPSEIAIDRVQQQGNVKVDHGLMAVATSGKIHARSATMRSRVRLICVIPANASGRARGFVGWPSPARRCPRRRAGRPRARRRRAPRGSCEKGR